MTNKETMQMALHAMHSAREFLAIVEDPRARLQETRLHDAMREVRAALEHGEQATINGVYHKLAASQEPLGAEAEKVLHDNLWDLYARSEDKND